jgi:hypothetical protein
MLEPTSKTVKSKVAINTPNNTNARLAKYRLRPITPSLQAWLKILFA